MNPSPLSSGLQQRHTVTCVPMLTQKLGYLLQVEPSTDTLRMTSVFTFNSSRNCARCAARWSRTLTMNKALCAKIGNGAFPSPAMLIQAGVGKLQTECGLGYRAKTLVRLAEQVLPFTLTPICCSCHPLALTLHCSACLVQVGHHLTE